jgi:hypothetical protein
MLKTLGIITPAVMQAFQAMEASVFILIMFLNVEAVITALVQLLRVVGVPAQVLRLEVGVAAVEAANCHP